MLKTKPLKLKLGSYAMHASFGPLYINDRFRDGGGTCFCGINGVDGVSYQDYATGFTKLLTFDEFQAAVAAKKGGDK